MTTVKTIKAFPASHLSEGIVLINKPINRRFDEDLTLGISRMAFHDHDYEVFVLKGTSKSYDLWKWQHWLPFANALAPFAVSARGNTTVRCNQYSSNPRKMVSFGKLTWTEASHRKWTHESPGMGDDWKQWHFSDLEAWAPSWNVCVKENLAPDFFLRVCSPKTFRASDVDHGPLVVCGVKSTNSADIFCKLESVLVSIAKGWPASALAHKRRPWGITSLGSNSFTYAIQDITADVFAGATEFDYLQRPFNEDLLPETWRVINVSDA